MAVDWSQQFANQLLRFESWQGKAEAMERQASERAQAIGGDKNPDYMAGQLLKDNFEYHQACANRSAAQKRAGLYGLAAILQHLRAMPDYGRHTTGNTIPLIPGGSDGGDQDRY